ncbi:MAG: hypothetical protein WCK26_03765 [Candidatus Saccharibacteria bacterium]
MEDEPQTQQDKELEYEVPVVEEQEVQADGTIHEFKRQGTKIFNESWETKNEPLVSQYSGGGIPPIDNPPYKVNTLDPNSKAGFPEDLNNRVNVDSLDVDKSFSKDGNNPDNIK